MSICKSCWRDIDWIRTAEGKAVPIDADADPVFVVEGEGKDIFYTAEGEQLRGRPARPEEVATQEAKMETPVGFVPHWKTCPNTAGFRRWR